MSTEKLDDLEPELQAIKGGADDGEQQPLVSARADEFGADASVAGADAEATLKGGTLSARIEP